MVKQLHTASLAIIIVFEVFGSIFCIGRLASRSLSVRGDSWRGLMMWSDMAMATAWVLSVGETVTMYKVTQLAHFGYHASDLAKMPYDFKEYARVSFINTLFYNPVLGLVKASMILLYLRLGRTKKGVRVGCYILLFAIFGHTLGTSIADFLQCLPIAYNWDRVAMDRAAQLAAGANQPGILGGFPWPTGFKDGKYVTGGQCFNLEYFLLISSALSIFTDLLMLMIPVYMVYDLQLTPKKKFVVLIVLCMGLSVTAVGAARFEILYSGYHARKGEDLNFSVRSTISQIETDLALVTGCIPDLFPLVRRCFPGFLRSEPRILPPNPYPYISESGLGSGLRSSTISESRSSYSRRVRKILTPNTSRNMSSIDEEMDIAHAMETFIWRGDNVRGAEVEVKGNADIEVSSSQAGIIEEALDSGKSIVKTTQFTVEEQDADSLYEKKWSNV